MLPSQSPRWIIRRALQNASLLFTGKTAAGIMQLATFALAARGLGLAEFGLFAMLLAQAQLVTGLAAFQSNQAIISYGVGHLRNGNMRAFQALIKAGALLDVSAAAAATIATIIIAPFVGAWLGWNGDVVFDAQLIAAIAFANANATPKGLLRLFGRFDLLTVHAAITPAARLAGIVVAYGLDAPITAYLIVWLVAGLCGAGVAIWLAWREANRHRCFVGLDLSLSGLARENPGVWRFTLISNLHSTLALIPGQFSTFIVGALLGPHAAGLFKIAREVGTGIAKPVDLINQTVYPDIARLVASQEWSRLRRTVVSAGALAAGVSAIATLIIALWGEPAIVLIFGEEYGPAVPVLLLMSLATTISVTVFAVDPMMYAFGRPGIALSSPRSPPMRCSSLSCCGECPSTA